MTTVPARRTLAEKREERRRALADSALTTLGELGYARASLREIAANSEFSHGVVHYYFTDKLDLIVSCVKQYKATCVHRYDGVVEGATTADGLAGSFAGALVRSVVDEAPMHRLWYDLRGQSMFEPALREAVLAIDATLQDMVWRVVTRYADLAAAPPVLGPAAAYGLLDGLFQQALLGHLTGRPDALVALGAEVVRLLPTLVTAPTAG